ncbi:MAG: UDP-glucose/GDP-mannose dehydrogenase family protein [Pseudomonas sp.]|uniref:UDP-glucose dehydrogenase family protein n=1 Tax=Pseudomonas sp. gcc21 TaxID=2726989 RepID=UPI0014523564|nr:UDP-glucose/GDP-mannose dehydrogenase family protein [Pseudomonas sp. gcc21]MBL4833241.1 UDP-glucose/GDP-mannose dehydrogenase family protein [Pseudomonas sp.]QJD57423.1 UDP-glucose/GDP-mannose dehydrogenase family protein [Pseudomonas sp. gcc21]
MKISIFGTGYVGLTQAACLAEVGHRVCCIDTDASRIAQLERGVSPIFENGLEALLQKNLAAGRLSFTTNAQQGVDFARIIFIAVGTPASEDGSADMRFVFSVADSIAARAHEQKLVINKSTSPVGTAQRIRDRILEALVQRGCDFAVQVISNPEFLKEGSAVEDCMRPERIIIGSDGECDVELIRALYKPFGRHHEKLIFMDSRSAELTKYAANSMLAAKISFINEIANLSERLGADIEMVRKGIGSDSRIGYDFIYPGCGYGGSCFPKDIQALLHSAGQVGYSAQLLEAVEDVNRRQKHKLFENIQRHYQGHLAGKTFALWGLAFKPNTDDMREAPSRVVLEALLAAGTRVCAYDPEAMDEARRIYADAQHLTFADSKEAALEGAHALVIVTEWLNFRIVDFSLLRQALADRVIFDGRNLLDPVQVVGEGLGYYSIGRASGSGGKV